MLRYIAVITIILSVNAGAQHVEIIESGISQENYSKKTISDDLPAKESTKMDIGKFAPTQSNYGGYQFGEYPKNSGINYPDSYLWIGGVIGGDTLVSVGGYVGGYANFIS